VIFGDRFLSLVSRHREVDATASALLGRVPGAMLRQFRETGAATPVL